MTATANHFGYLKFLKPETQSSLFRNDLVRMVRDQRGNFVESHGVATESHELKIADARQLAPSARMDLQRNGFELVGTADGISENSELRDRTTRGQTKASI